MKRLLFIITVVLLFSCKKDSELSSFKNQVSGTWELERSIGLISINYPPGNGRIIVLTSNGIYERKQHDTLLLHGTYTLSRKNDCYPRNSDIILSTTESSLDTYIEIENGKLVLSESNCIADGSIAYYRRLQ